MWGSCCIEGLSWFILIKGNLTWNSHIEWGVLLESPWWAHFHDSAKTLADEFDIHQNMESCDTVKLSINSKPSMIWHVVTGTCINVPVNNNSSSFQARQQINKQWWRLNFFVVTHFDRFFNTQRVFYNLMCCLFNSFMLFSYYYLFQVTRTR